MITSILLPIQPKWCELIASGKKIFEIRKNSPNLKVPFRCYIYCTKQNINGEIILTKSEQSSKRYEKNKVVGINKGFSTSEDINLQGKVIGEFTCDKITKFEISDVDILFGLTLFELQSSCVPYDEIIRYIGERHYGYSWSISDLKIYENPKLLSDFKDCNGNLLTKAPQSWCYVDSDIPLKKEKIDA